MLAASAVLLMLLSFSYGFVSGKFKIFPFGLIAATERALPVGADSLSEKLRISLVEFEKKIYNRRGMLGLKGWGGALELVGDIVLGVDSKGQFFRYDGHGHVELLPIALETGEHELLLYASSKGIDESPMGPGGKFFRVLDLTVLNRQNEISIFVSHNHWDDARKGKTSRISRLTLSRKEALVVLDGTSQVKESDWEVIYETRPFLPFDPDPLSDFNHNHSGGRMVIDNLGYLIVGFGDQQENYDDSSEPYRPQDKSSSLGKFLRIDLESLEVDVLAKGTRNPQGLTMDVDGNIWSTEHGPWGGDELNLIRAGANYGWPYETYGTQFPMYTWPLSEQQGRHLKYEKPVFAWVPSIGVSNLIQVRDVPPEWHGDLLVSSLRARSLFRIRLHDTRVIFVEPIQIGDRIRDLIQMSDGRILLWTDTGRLIELQVG